MEINRSTSKNGLAVVKRLRETKLRAGSPFMINLKELATNQCYLEYPDGTIQFVAVMHAKRDVDIIKELTITEANALRKRLDFHTVM